MDIVTFALCKKMTQNGVSSDEVKQQIEEIKKLIEQIEVDKEEYDIKLSSIEENILYNPSSITLVWLLISLDFVSLLLSTFPSILVPSDFSFKVSAFSVCSS